MNTKALSWVQGATWVNTRWRGLSLFGLASLLSLSAMAQSNVYPQKPIKLIVPLAAGSAVDNAARIVMQKVATNMGASIAVENQAGAAGLIGADRVAKSAPDGYPWVASMTAS